MRSLLARLALVVASIAASLLLAEGVVRLVAPQQLVELRPDIWEPDEDGLGYRHAAHVATTINAGEGTVALRTDAQGHRIRASPAHGADARRLVLALGDSFVAALGVEYEETFTARLDAALATAAGESVRVVNAGVSGHGPSHYLISARRELARAAYNGVLVFVYVLNDVVGEKVARYPPRAHSSSADVRMPTSMQMKEWNLAVFQPVYSGLRKRSHLAVLAKARLSGPFARLGLQTELGFPPEIVRENAYAPNWTVTAEILAEIAQAARQRQTATLYVLIPSRFQVVEELAWAAAAFYDVDPSQVDLDQPNRRLREELETLGLDVVDTLPEIRARQANGETLYGSVDSHLGPAGHAAVADATATAAAAAFGYGADHP